MLASRTATTAGQRLLRSCVAAPSSSLLRQQQHQQPRGSITKTTMTKRFMGGGGHHHDDLPIPQSMQARLFDGHPSESEGWETSFVVTYGIAFLMGIIAVCVAPDTTIKSWAHVEAKTRLALLESGKIEKVEFGRHYHQEIMESGKQMEQWEHIMNKRVTPGDSDDDDDEEEEENEEEE